MNTMALTSFCNIFYGTVKGYDELYPSKLSVVTERRPYLLDCDLNKEKKEVEKDGYNVGIILRPK